MLVQTAGRSWLFGGVPRTGRNLHDVGPQMIADHDSGEDRAPLVEHSYYIAVANASAGGIGWADPDRLATSHFALLADAAHIHLTVEPRGRLGCQQMQRIAF